jgi:hypothetical protein
MRRWGLLGGRWRARRRVENAVGRGREGIEWVCMGGTRRGRGRRVGWVRVESHVLPSVLRKLCMLRVLLVLRKLGVLWHLHVLRMLCCVMLHVVLCIRSSGVRGECIIRVIRSSMGV